LKSSLDNSVSISAIYNLFYKIWLHRKFNYMNYCRQNEKFWPTLISTLQILKNESTDQVESSEAINDENQQLNIYAKYFNFNMSENDLVNFDELILESSIKSVSFVFKILSLELFELHLLSKQSKIPKELQIFLEKDLNEKKLIEKWLEFYNFQLSVDLSDERMFILNKIDQAEIQQQFIKPDLSIIGSANDASEQPSEESNVTLNRKKLKSKILFDSIKIFLLLLNKINRSKSADEDSNKQTIEKGTCLENIKLTNNQLKSIIDFFISSVSQIIEFFLATNNLILEVRQEQQWQQQQEDLGDISSTLLFPKTSSAQNAMHKRFILLKQSNEVVKQFHSLSSSLLILITSIKQVEQFNTEKLKGFIQNLIFILESLLNEDLNYFPSIVNSIQTSILHLFVLNESSLKQTLETDGTLFKRLLTTFCKIFNKSCNFLDGLKDSNAYEYGDDVHVRQVS
jgi:hypothetical protein